RTGPLVRSTIAFDGVLDAADRVLHLAFGLVQLAFALKLRVAGQFACAFFHLDAQIGRGAFCPILVHDVLRRTLPASGGQAKATAKVSAWLLLSNLLINLSLPNP